MKYMVNIRDDDSVIHRWRQVRGMEKFGVVSDKEVIIRICIIPSRKCWQRHSYLQTFQHAHTYTQTKMRRGTGKNWQRSGRLTLYSRPIHTTPGRAWVEARGTVTDTDQCTYVPSTYHTSCLPDAGLFTLKYRC